MENTYLNFELIDSKEMALAMQIIQEELGKRTGQNVSVVIGKPIEPVKHSSRKFLMGVVLKEVSEQTGYTVQELWDHCKEKFLKDELDPHNSNSTKHWSDEKYRMLTDRIVRYFLELGFVFGSTITGGTNVDGFRFSI